MGCFSVIIMLVGAIFTMVSMIRWYEQVTEAVEQDWWNKVFVLLAMPYTVWFFPSQIAAGRPTPFPIHEPVRGFGSMPKAPTMTPPPGDQPPPGTPKEFLGPPVIPPQKKRKSSVDPAQLAKLKEKMRQQGMLPPE